MEEENNVSAPVAENEQPAPVADELSATGADSDVLAAGADCQTENGASSDNSNKKANIGAILKKYFTATRIAYIALFTAISYVLGLFDFSLLPSTPVNFLKLDFSNVLVLVGGFSLGPVAGVIIAVIKELLHAITVGHTAFVGELANILMVLPYVLIPSIIYKKYKGIKSVIIGIVLGCLAQCLISLPVNYLLTFPAFLWSMGKTWAEGQQLFVDLWYWTLLFNFIKTLCVSAVVFIVYKPLSKLIKITNEKFTKRKKAEQ